MPGLDSQRYELTVAVTRIVFPMAGILVLSAWALGILNSHRNFFLPYFAPGAVERGDDRHAAGVRAGDGAGRSW